MNLTNPYLFFGFYLNKTFETSNLIYLLSKQLLAGYLYYCLPQVYSCPFIYKVIFDDSTAVPNSRKLGFPLIYVILCHTFHLFTLFYVMQDYGISSREYTDYLVNVKVVSQCSRTSWAKTAIWDQNSLFFPYKSGQYLTGWRLARRKKSG